MDEIEAAISFLNQNSDAPDGPKWLKMACFEPMFSICFPYVSHICPLCFHILQWMGLHSVRPARSCIHKRRSHCTVVGGFFDGGLITSITM